MPKPRRCPTVTLWNAVVPTDDFASPDRPLDPRGLRPLLHKTLPVLCNRRNRYPGSPAVRPLATRDAVPVVAPRSCACHRVETTRAPVDPLRVKIKNTTDLYCDRFHAGAKAIVLRRGRRGRSDRWRRTPRPAPGPTQQVAELEVAIASDARIGRAAVQIILGKRLHHGFDKLRAQIDQRVGDTEQLGDFFRTAMIRAHPRTNLPFPHAQRDALDVIALLDEQRRRHRTIDAAAHGDDNLFPCRLHRSLKRLERTSD